MRKLACLALALIANLSGVSYAAAPDLMDGGLEARLSWQLGFGGGQVLHTGYGLAVGYRGYGPGAVAGQLFQLDVTDTGALASFAGLPVVERSYRAGQNDLATEAAEPAQAKPWYTRQWVMWTAGGLAATLALTGGDGTVDLCHNCNGSNGGTNGGSNIASVNGDGEVCGTQGVPGVPDTCAEAGGCVPGSVACVNCNDSGVTQDCEGEGWTSRPTDVAATTTRDAEPAWLSEGTGRMGDLIAAP